MLAASPAQARQMEDMGVVVLRTIDKSSARTTTFEVPVDKTVKFGPSLFIKPRACRKASALDLPENAAFLQIWEHKPHEDNSSWVFSGWMFSSNPGASAMDHPVYDVWVMDCKNAATAAKAQPFSAEATPATPAPNTPAPESATPVKTETPAPVPVPIPAPVIKNENIKPVPTEAVAPAPPSAKGPESPSDKNGAGAAPENSAAPAEAPKPTVAPAAESAPAPQPGPEDVGAAPNRGD